MLVYHDVPQPVLTDYTIRSFDTKYECIEYTWDNKVEMVDTLLDMHRYKEDKELKKKIINRDVDMILEKIKDVGFSGLSDEEQSKLYEASKKMSKDGDKD